MLTTFFNFKFDVTTSRSEKVIKTNILQRLFMKPLSSDEENFTLI